MRVIAWKRIREFCETHPDAEPALTTWYNIVEEADWKRFADVRKTFNDADKYGNCYIFNIRGNRYRLIARISVNWIKVYIRDILTHKEYDRGKWKDEC